MKKYFKFVIYILSFIIIFVLAVIGYNELSDKYYPIEVEKVKDKEDNKKVIDFTVFKNNEEKVNLSDFYGKPIIVNFWATWCGPCKSELPAFDEVYKKYNEKIEFLMVNLTGNNGDTIENVTKFISDNNYKFPVYFDKEYSASNAYNIYSIPQTLFIDKNGNIIKIYTGKLNKEILENYIEKIK